MTQTKITFGRKVDDYHSEVLWRIQDAEELLKSRVSEQRVKDLNNVHVESVEQKITEQEKRIFAKMKEVYDKCEVRIKTNEHYMNDKMTETKKYMAEVDAKASSMATVKMIE